MEPRNGSHRYSPILHYKDSSCLHRGRRKGPWRSITLVAISAVSAVALFFCLLGLMSRPTSPTPGKSEFTSFSKIFGDAKDDTMATMSVQVQHSYSSDDNMQMYPWKHTAEPYRKTVMQVLMGWPSDLPGVEFRWDFVLEGKEENRDKSLLLIDAVPTTTSIFISHVAVLCAVHGDYIPASYPVQQQYLPEKKNWHHTRTAPSLCMSYRQSKTSVQYIS